ASIVPTTLAGHRFWEHTDPTERFGQISNFVKNAGLLGGLLLAAVDTEGKPSVGWRARKAAHAAAEATEKGVGRAQKRAAKAHKGRVPEYLAKLEETHAELVPLADDVAEFRSSLRGDLHAHSDWSDGGSPIREMAEAAIGIGHDYLALTDHSPRLTVANGLTPERLERQLDEVAALNEELAPFRILTGIEVDINVDG